MDLIQGAVTLTAVVGTGAHGTLDGRVDMVAIGLMIHNKIPPY